MVTWKEYLLGELEEYVRDSPHAKDWLLRLDFDKEAEILGRSLAIDLASLSLRPDQLGEILKGIPAHRSHAGAELIAAIDDHGSCRFLSIVTNGDAGGEDVYARVIGLHEFFAYSYKDSYGVSWSAEDINDLRLELQGREGLSLGEIDAGFSGANNINWISNLEELENEIGEAGSFIEEAATVIADCLGLPGKRPIVVGEPPELLLVVYPRGWKFQFWKPTTIDGFWIDGFFLSGGECDDWGQTQSCSGTRLPKRERIHKGFETLTHAFRAWYIGPVGTITPDREALYSASQQRWDGYMGRLHAGRD